MKEAKLVVTTFITRVVVEEGDTSEEIARKTALHLAHKIQNDEVYENIDNISDDTECPYGTFDSEKMKCPACGSMSTRNDYDHPDTMRCCSSCLADFNVMGDLTLDPATVQ